MIGCYMGDWKRIECCNVRVGRDPMMKGVLTYDGNVIGEVIM